MVLLKKIQINNFLSHVETVIDFNERESVLIDGLSGSGKSSIVDAITWVLYGKIRDSENRKVIHGSEKKTEVTLSLTKDDSIFHITRTATLSGKHDIVIKEEKEGEMVIIPITRIKEQQEWIEEEITGASYKLFINSVVYPQDSREGFVFQSAKSRRDILLEIADVEDFDNKYAKTVKAIKVREEKKNGVESVINLLNTQIVDANNIVKSNNIELENIKVDNEEFQSLKTLHDTYSNKVINLSSSISTLLRDSDIYHTRISAITEQMAQLPDSALDTVDPEDIKKEIDILENEYSNEIQEEQRLLVALNENKENQIILDKLQKEKPVEVITGHMIELLDHELTEANNRYKNEKTCPAGDACPHKMVHLDLIHNIESRLQKSRIEREKYMRGLADWQYKLDRVNTDNTIQDKYIAQQNIKNTINKKIQDKKNELTELDNVISNIEHKKGLSEEGESLKSQLNVLRESIDSITIELDEAKKNMSDTAVRIKEIERNMSRKDALVRYISMIKEQVSVKKTEVEKQQDELNNIKNELESLALLKDALSPKGIKTLVIDYLLPHLEDKVNSVLGQLSEFSVHIGTQRDSGDGKSVVEGIFVTIINEQGRELPFELYSGGEKVKIMVAFSEALASMQRVGFRVFDEVFVGLDENSTENFVNVLQTLLLDFNQVICISHLRQIKDLFNSDIEVYKINGKSYVK